MTQSWLTLRPGHYQAEEYRPDTKRYEKHDGIQIFISVDVRGFPFGAVSDRLAPWC